jgi:hypothetical protein
MRHHLPLDAVDLADRPLVASHIDNVLTGKASRGG